MVQFFYGGPPVSVFGMQRLGKTGVDESFVGQMRYPGGVFTQISSGFRSEFHNHFELVGDEGRLVLTRPFRKMDRDRHLIFYPNHGRRRAIPVPKLNSYLGEIEDMNAAIMEGTPLYLSLTETRNHVRTALALYDSARTGLPVDL